METQHGRQSFVNAPLLIWSDPAHKVAKPAGVDGADLLDENARSLPPPCCVARVWHALASRWDAVIKLD